MVFIRARVAVFCDGDFWHGRFWNRRRSRLKSGHNASYWIAKLDANRKRDKRVNAELEAKGWHVMRVWESDVLKAPHSIAEAVMEFCEKRRDEGSHDRRRVEGEG